MVAMPACALAGMWAWPVSGLVSSSAEPAAAEPAAEEEAVAEEGCGAFGKSKHCRKAGSAAAARWVSAGWVSAGHLTRRSVDGGGSADVNEGGGSTDVKLGTAVEAAAAVMAGEEEAAGRCVPCCA